MSGHYLARSRRVPRAPWPRSQPRGRANQSRPVAQPATEKPKTYTQPLSPAVRKMVEENKLDPSAIDGSGKDGRITKGDVIDEIARPAKIDVPRVMPAVLPPTPPQTARPLAPPDDAKREERVKMTRLRQTIARRLKDAQNTAAMLTTFNEVDMSAVMELRTQYKELFEKKHGAKLGFMGFFVKASIQALEGCPGRQCRNRRR